MPSLKEIRESKKLSQEEFAQLIGTNRTYLSKLEGGKHPISQEMRFKIEKATGETLTIGSIDDITTIPYYNVDIMATPVEVFNDQTINPEYEISLPGFTDCEFAINIYGDSMYPTYRSGSIVLCRRVNDKNIILWGEAYLVVTDDYRVLKRIERSKKEEHILLTSDNYHAKDEERIRYQPIEIHLDDIRHLFIVKGTLNRQQI